MPSVPAILMLVALLALAACAMPAAGTIPFTPTSDQGGGDAVVQNWLARHPGG